MSGSVVYPVSSRLDPNRLVLWGALPAWSA